MSPEKAELCGLIASDGGLGIYWKYSEERGYYQSSYKSYFSSSDQELIETFSHLVEEVYHETPRVYEDKEGFDAYVYDRKVYFDLADIGAKTGPFEFRVPREHLDEEGKRKYLRGFFSGDGEAYREAHGYVIEFESTCKEGIEEIHETLEDLGFHPHPIHPRDYDEENWHRNYRFTIPSAEHIKFIEEIGSDKPSHQEVFEEIKKYREGIRQYKLREHEERKSRKYEDE